VPEVARGLGVDGAEVYELVLDGELPAASGDDGLVYVTAEALEGSSADTRQRRSSARRAQRFAIFRDQSVTTDGMSAPVTQKPQAAQSADLRFLHQA
jgi:hypothetical protein